MNQDNDMDHVKSVHQLRNEQAAGIRPSGVYGDALGATGFTDSESELLRSVSGSVACDGGEDACEVCSTGPRCDDCAVAHAPDHNGCDQCQALSGFLPQAWERR